VVVVGFDGRFYSPLAHSLSRTWSFLQAFCSRRPLQHSNRLARLGRHCLYFCNSQRFLQYRWVFTFTFMISTYLRFLLVVVLGILISRVDCLTTFDWVGCSRHTRMALVINLASTPTSSWPSSGVDQLHSK
jgi:hypothetical protein